MEIRPFRGWRYSPPAGGDISPFIAPPYDILSPQDKHQLLQQSERNIVAADLPHCPASDVGPEEVYRQAAQKLEQWKAAGVLKQDPRAALYAYRQSFTWAGRSYTRRAMLCGVRLSELGRQVIPHEKVFPGPKADRLKLTECTRMQLSPIFGFFHDPGAALDLLFSPLGEPDAHGVLRGVEEKLWAVSNGEVIAEIASILREAPIFIADGHHRYTTALNYRDQLLQAGKIGPEHEANFVLFALVRRDDPGLLILPTHRIIRGLKEDFSVAAMTARCPEFSWRRCGVRGADLADADAFLRRFGRGAMLLIDHNQSEGWIGKLSDPSAMDKLAGDQLPVWRELDVAVLHQLIIDKALSSWRTDRTQTEYTPDSQTVLSACASRKAQLGVCLQSTPLEAVEAVARGGGAMPHKSTYFYPKLATGIVLKSLE